MTDTIEVREIEQDSEFSAVIDSWSCGLWWPDFEEAGIARCFVALEDNLPVGFQTVDRDGLCTAIEVKEGYKGKGVALALIEESNCWKPDRDENPDFWAAIKEKFDD